MTREEEQTVFDNLTAALDKHNKVIAETILVAEESLKSAKEQLRSAESVLVELKKHIKGNNGE